MANVEKNKLNASTCSPAQLRWRRYEKKKKKTIATTATVVVTVLLSSSFDPNKQRARTAMRISILLNRNKFFALQWKPSQRIIDPKLKFDSILRLKTFTFFLSCICFMLDVLAEWSRALTHFARSQRWQIYLRCWSRSWWPTLSSYDWVFEFKCHSYRERKQFSLSLSSRASWNGNRLINNNYWRKSMLLEHRSCMHYESRKL